MKTPVIFDSCLLLHRAIFAIPIPGIGRDERGHWQFDPIIYHRGDIGTDPKEDNMWRRLGLITIALLAILAGLAHGETASAKDFRFIASGLAPDRAIWLPGMVMLDQKKDLEEPLHFVLENPTEDHRTN